jgi:hypothetical protein
MSLRPAHHIPPAPGNAETKERRRQADRPAKKPNLMDGAELGLVK